MSALLTVEDVDLDPAPVAMRLRAELRPAA